MSPILHCNKLLPMIGDSRMQIYLALPGILPIGPRLPKGLISNMGQS